MTDTAVRAQAARIAAECLRGELANGLDALDEYGEDREPMARAIVDIADGLDACARGATASRAQLDDCARRTAAGQAAMILEAALRSGDTVLWPLLADPDRARRTSALAAAHALIARLRVQGAPGRRAARRKART